MSLRVYAYAGCDTCRRALRWLREREITHEIVPIRERPPTKSELQTMLGAVGGEVRRLFNTSGRDYQALGLKDRLAAMDLEEAVTLLAQNGNLVKRPFALSGNSGAVGFKPDEWKRLLARP